jgi:hypothetical protein
MRRVFKGGRSEYCSNVENGVSSGRGLEARGHNLLMQELGAQNFDSIKVQVFSI